MIISNTFTLFPSCAVVPRYDSTSDSEFRSQAEANDHTALGALHPKDVSKASLTIPLADIRIAVLIFLSLRGIDLFSKGSIVPVAVMHVYIQLGMVFFSP